MADLKITTGGKERVPNAADVLAEAFRVDPTITFMLNSMTQEQRLAYLPTFFSALVKAAALNSASLDEVGDWASCGILVPPGSKVDNPLTWIPAGLLSVMWTVGIAGIQRFFVDLGPLTDACKSKALRKGEKYYYVFFLGTRENARGRGLCSAMIRHYQAIAERESLPIYMEAATEYCWRLYQRLGFVTIDEMNVGKGKAAADGTRLQGGPGVRIWGMIWRPDAVVAASEPS